MLFEADVEFYPYEQAILKDTVNGQYARSGASGLPILFKAGLQASFDQLSNSANVHLL